MTERTQILIIGGSASGVCAALQAARMGMDVVLTEASPWIGGMLTAAGVSAIDGNHALPSGLWGEFRGRLVSHYGGSGQLATGWVSNTQFEPRVAHSLLEQMVADEPRITLCLGWTLTAVEREGRTVRGARFTDRSKTHHTVHAAYTICADEYGEAVRLADLPWRTGFEGRSAYNENCGPETPLPHPQDFTWVATLRMSADLVLSERIPEWANSGVYGGIVAHPDHSWAAFLEYGRLPDNLTMLNWPIHGNDYSGADLYRTSAAPIFEAAQNKTLELVARLQELVEQGSLELATDAYPVPERFAEAPGPDHWHPPAAAGLALIPYIREARRIYGMQTLTLHDLLYPSRGYAMRDSIAVGDYPLDHHRQQDTEAPVIEFPDITAFCVPYGVLVPENARGILVAEKSVSVSGIANGCTRLQPVVMQLGQAAGAAAALSIRNNIDAADLSVPELQDALLASGCYLVPACDISPDDHDFERLQRDVLAGEKDLTYDSAGWANRAYARPRNTRQQGA